MTRLLTVAVLPACVVLLSAAVVAGCVQHEFDNPYGIDDDEDGVPLAEDCDDSDPATKHKCAFGQPCLWSSQCKSGRCEQAMCIYEDGCVPVCAGKNCGSDGCGGSCGSCFDLEGAMDNDLCVNGQCVDCLHSCEGRECGDDGCGGSCGTCEEGWQCDGGACVSPPTWTDPTSGLTWQVTPTGNPMNWAAAKTHCANLSLDGGGWHLPTIGELRTLIRGCPPTEAGGSCNIEEGGCLKWSCQDGSCNGCSYKGGPASGYYWPSIILGPYSWYWSSSPVEDLGAHAWYVHFDYGDVYSDGVDSDRLARCVR